MPSKGLQLQKQVLHPHPYKCNRNKNIYHNTRYESDSKTEESHTRHLHISSNETHPPPDTTTFGSEDVESDTEPENSFTTHSDESITCSVELKYFIPQSDDKHSIIDYTQQPDDKHSVTDYQYTPQSTDSPPQNNAFYYPTQLPRPSKVINNNTNNLKPAARNSQKSVQRKVPTTLIPTANPENTSSTNTTCAS